MIPTVRQINLFDDNNVQQAIPSSNVVDNSSDESMQPAQETGPRYAVIHNRSGRIFIKTESFEEIEQHLFEENAGRYTLHDRKHNQFLNAEIIFKSKYNRQ